MVGHRPALHGEPRRLRVGGPSGQPGASGSRRSTDDLGALPGENGRAIGIENEGTYVTETPPKALTDSLVTLCVAICRQYGLHAHDIFGHWDFRTTECPGAAFYRQFPELRRRVHAALGTKLGDVPARRWPDLWRFVNSPRSGWCSTCSPTGATR
ncbi:peptidoglycan recognition family protein [Micromonospora sp. M12]